MLLRQFISSSNAIEEIYIVKRENESDDDESPPVSKLVPETGNVPEAVMIVPEGVSSTSNDQQVLEAALEIKSEPEDEDHPVETVPTEDRDNPDPAKIEVKNEDEDEVPLAVRLRRSKAARRKNNKRESSSERNFSDGVSGSDSDQQREQKEPNCNICDMSFITTYELKGHLKRKHSQMLPFRCDKCTVDELKSVLALNKHFALHDPSLPHKCAYCEARFLTRIHRTAHQRRYHRDELDNDTVRNANRRFICRYCNKRFSAKFNLERHERNHEMRITDDEIFLNRRNKCYLCDMKPCDTKQELIQHLSVHVDKVPYTCEKCDPDPPVIITSVRLLNKHLASHEEPEKPIKCVYCNERFISVVACQAHEKTHSEEKKADEVAVAKIESERISAKIVIVDGMKRYECSYCGNSYSLLSTLRRHENIHTGRVQYVCKVCGKIFNKSSCLLQHERTHSQNAPYKCEICQRGFKETIRLIEHRRIHSGERPFTCDVCFKSFRIKPLLKEHSLQCTAPDADQKNQCRFCELWFDNYRGMADHVAEQHTATISETQCQFCDLSYKDALQLVEHEHQHRNPNSIRCGVCGRIFKQLSNLRRHQRLHSEDSVPYTCDLCGKSFSQAGALTVHKRIHSGEKPYKCELCDKKFYHSSTMNRHKRSHYKAKSKLYLFAGAGDPVPDGMLMNSQQLVSTPQPIMLMGQQQPMESTIPVSVEAHHHLMDPQVPNTMPLIGYELSAVDGGATTTTLEDGTSLYVLDTKLLIPQTITEVSVAAELGMQADLQQQQQHHQKHLGMVLPQ